MDRVTWRAVIIGLDDALALCRHLGLEDLVSQSRFITYRDVIAGLVSALENGGQEGARARFNTDPELSMIALTEAVEFGDVCEFVRQYQEQAVRPTVRRVLDGPVLPLEEDQNSNEGRNRLFELVVASKLWKAGLRPRLGDRPDLTCEVPGKVFYVECKRPLSERGVPQGIGRASNMLIDELRTTGGSALGVIAVSFTRLLNPGDQLLVYRGESDGKTKLSRALEAAAASVRSSWAGLPSDIVGLLFHAITPGIDESIPLYVTAQYMNVQPLAPPYSLEEQWFRLLYDALARVWGHE